MLQCANILLLTVRFLDVTQFTIQNPLLLMILCKLSFPIAGLKMLSLPTLAMKSPNKMFTWYLGNLSNICSNSSQKQSFTSSILSSVGHAISEQ
jgi:hypothetical protein